MKKKKRLTLKKKHLMKTCKLQNNIDFLFENSKIEHNFDLYFSDLFREKEIDTYSIINLKRYRFALQKYMNSYHQFTFDLDSKNCITLQITTTNNPTILSLTFQRNGLVDFLSIESFDNQEESKPFYLQGTIETSNNRKYAYKLERLLNMLDVLTYENNIVYFIDKASHQFYSPIDSATTKEHLPQSKSYIYDYVGEVVKYE